MFRSSGGGGLIFTRLAVVNHQVGLKIHVCLLNSGQIGPIDPIRPI